MVARDTWVRDSIEAHSWCLKEFIFWGQGKHGFAAHGRGARSRKCCGESPRALGQRVPVGDCGTLALVAGGEASGLAAAASLSHWQQHSHAVSAHLECQPNGAHSPHASINKNSMSMPRNVENKQLKGSV